MRWIGGVLVLLTLTLSAQDKSPFSRDYNKNKDKENKGQPAAALPKKGPANESKKKPDGTHDVIKKANDWLAKNQQANGSWATQLGGNAGLVTVTSWCGLALIAAGDAYRPQVDKAAQFVMANIFSASNGIGGQWDQTNWQIGIGGLFLCEYYALSKAAPAAPQAKPAEPAKPENGNTRNVPQFPVPGGQQPQAPQAPADPNNILEKIVDEIVKRMEPSGGWGHGPHVKNALNYLELEVMSNWMLATLGACQRLGVKVPGETIAKACKFVEDCCNPGQGGVGYSPGPGQKGIQCPCRTGGAIFGFAVAKMQGHPLFPRMIESWKKTMGNSGEGHGSLAMGLLESALGARQIGPDAWDNFVAQFFPLILQHHNGDGSFKHITGKTPMSMGGDSMTGPCYPTGVLAFIMQLDLGNLRFCGVKH